ncbi:MAG: hypothetical protein ACRD4P_16890 [Bryobacteraceae bacterium]
MTQRFPACSVTLAVIFSISTWSCSKKHAAIKLPPPSSTQAAPETKSAPVTPPPPELPASTTQASLGPSLPVNTQVPPPPPKNKKKKKRSHARRAKNTVPSQEESTQQATAAPAQSGEPENPTSEQPSLDTSEPAPRLGPLLSAADRQRYESDIDGFLSHAGKNLSSLADHSLSKDQRALKLQAENFIKQAKELRSSDLPAARSLAQRADLLASHLAENFRQ